MKTSNYSGFYRLSPEERLNEVAEFASLTEEEKSIIYKPGALEIDRADHMIENVIGTFQLPMGIGLNFLINGKDYLIPMVIEEPSVVAAASNAAKMARPEGGFTTTSYESVMIAQLQLTGVENPAYARHVIYENKEKIFEICNEKDPVLFNLGGGIKDISVRIIDTAVGKMVITHLEVNTLDAMGANAVNSMAEAVAPFIESITGGTVYLRILSNLAVHRLARSRAVFSKDVIGEDVIEKILMAYAFADADPYRAATHNKGIMNGIIPVVTATGNDTRAIESGAHAYASITGRYRSLTTWEKNADGNLVGTIEVPMAVGLVGGATKIHPTAQTAIKILGVKSANELGGIIASVGLAQNFAAIKALATEGIQRGHMSLHARNIASVAGAKGDELERIVQTMIKDKKINLEYARDLMEKKSF